MNTRVYAEEISEPDIFASLMCIREDSAQIAGVQIKSGGGIKGL